MFVPMVTGHLANHFRRLLLGVALAASYGPGALAQQPVSTTPSAVQTAAQVGAYWTPERMASAIPMPLPAAEATGTPVQRLTGLPNDSFPTTMPGWDPGSGLPQPTRQSGSVIRPGAPEYARIMCGLPTTFGSPPFNPLDYANYGPFQRWTWFGNYLTYPTSTIGKMFFSQAGGNYVCSGTVWNRNMFLTAGHCVSNGAGTFSSNILFCPSYYRASGSGAPFPTRGCWAWSGYAVTTSDWHLSSNFDRDYACVVTNTTGTVVNDSIGDVTGWAGWAVNFPASQQVFSTGYPAATPFLGFHIVYTAATEWYTVNTSSSESNVSKYIGSDQTSGSSGGSWWLNMGHRLYEYTPVDSSESTDPRFGNGGPLLNGVNSHKRCLVNCNNPPSASAGVYWDEAGSPQFTESSSDDRDVIDIYDLCYSNGGS